MMDYIFEIIDKNKRKIHLTKERLKHIQKHPNMNDSIENIKNTLKNPLAVRYENNKNTVYFYKEFKQMHKLERYFLISVKYLNGKGFVVTAFFTNKITGEKWTEK